MQFISEWLKKEQSVTALCESYGISRKTGHKLINRYEAMGEEGLKPFSSSRHSHPNKTPRDTETVLINYKSKFPQWGPRTIKLKLEKLYPGTRWPAASTIGEIYKRHGLVKPRKYRRKTPAYTNPFLSCDAANVVWSADYKGQFKMGDGQYCYPLTITDNYSRFILSCDGMYRPETKTAKQCFERVFIDYGLPDAIRTDNGSPFASSGISGLSQLSIWWIKLGIIHERIQAGHPEQNGRHERMHRTLKAHTTQPAEYNLKQQNKRFKDFIDEFNNERPHQGIDDCYPCELYEKSKREYPSKLKEVSYPDDFEVRRVRSNGEIKWKGHKIFVSEALCKEPVGLEHTDENKVLVYFGSVQLGLLENKRGRIIRPDIW